MKHTHTAFMGAIALPQSLIKPENNPKKQRQAHRKPCFILFKKLKMYKVKALVDSD